MYRILWADGSGREEYRWSPPFPFCPLNRQCPWKKLTGRKKCSMVLLINISYICGFVVLLPHSLNKIEMPEIPGLWGLLFEVPPCSCPQRILAGFLKQMCLPPVLVFLVSDINYSPLIMEFFSLLVNIWETPWKFKSCQSPLHHLSSS